MLCGLRVFCAAMSSHDPSATLHVLQAARWQISICRSSLVMAQTSFCHWTFKQNCYFKARPPQSHLQPRRALQRSWHHEVRHEMPHNTCLVKPSSGRELLHPSQHPFAIEGVVDCSHTYAQHCIRCKAACNSISLTVALFPSRQELALYLALGNALQRPAMTCLPALTRTWRKPPSCSLTVQCPAAPHTC